MNPHHPCYHNCHPGAEIPEPGTWLLILIGVVALIVWKNWRKKA